MRTDPRLLVLGCLTALFWGACQQTPAGPPRDPALGQGDGGLAGDGGAGGPGDLEIPPPPPDSLVEVPINCDGGWRPGPLPDPWWLKAPPASCQDPLQNSLQHMPPQAYDLCKPTPEGYDLGACGQPAAGAVICNGYYLTQNCQSSADCPAGMGCAAGICEKTCTGNVGPAECIFCGRTCVSGLCAGEAPPSAGPPCQADCECPCESTGRCICVNGQCEAHIIPPIGLCPLGGNGNGATDCDCGNGQCRPSSTSGSTKYGCCSKADGTIAGPDDPECAP